MPKIFIRKSGQRTPLEQAKQPISKPRKPAKAKQSKARAAKAPAGSQVAQTLCQCGCGQPVAIAKKTSSAYGSVKGEPKRYVQGHNPRPPAVRPNGGGRQRESVPALPLPLLPQLPKLCECNGTLALNMPDIGPVCVTCGRRKGIDKLTLKALEAAVEDKRNGMAPK